jgi:hypothetical protein
MGENLHFNSKIYLQTNLSDKIENTTENSTWANDNTVFIHKQDEEIPLR